MSTQEEWDAERAAYLEGFAANVRRIRGEKGLSQMDLERASRLHRTEIGRIEKAKVEPRLMTLYILADGLGVAIDDLVAGLPVPRHRKPSPQEQRQRKSS
ncbi:MAG TPA: helix-turn-helix transcriptional regulator [Solirubrobacteraceae bacterium]|jgi:transcriptional regulator with XRE-family HTH domain